MSKNKVEFSRLLRIFKLNDAPAFIIELKSNGIKKLYLSSTERNLSRTFFERGDFIEEHFKNLSSKCLLSTCEDASEMFYKSPITHFEADCPNLKKAEYMFMHSKELSFFNGSFPLLENSKLMFGMTKIKEIDINFPNLLKSEEMFLYSKIKKFNGSLESLEEGDRMFAETNIEQINSFIPKIKNLHVLFSNPSKEFRRSYPHYFV